MRSPASHKGQNGSVAIIGGSPTIHGAPIFSALSAEASGVDLVFLSLPQCHAVVARSASMNVQVHPFARDTLSSTDREPLLELLATMDAAVIGPGVERAEKPLAALRNIVTECACPLVLDASALQPWTPEVVSGKTAILTPHLGELERMGIAPDEIGAMAKRHGIVIHLKGPIDRIAGADGNVREVSGGNAGLTVGGTGDALAGLIAGLLAQGYAAIDACTTASQVIKRSGDVLRSEYGYAYGTKRVIESIPHILRTLEK